MKEKQHHHQQQQSQNSHHSKSNTLIHSNSSFSQDYSQNYKKLNRNMSDQFQLTINNQQRFSYLNNIKNNVNCLPQNKTNVLQLMDNQPRKQHSDTVSTKSPLSKLNEELKLFKNKDVKHEALLSNPNLDARNFSSDARNNPIANDNHMATNQLTTNNKKTNKNELNISNSLKESQVNENNNKNCKKSERSPKNQHFSTKPASLSRPVNILQNLMESITPSASNTTVS